jgi:hypothetical protein
VKWEQPGRTNIDDEIIEKALAVGARLKGEAAHTRGFFCKVGNARGRLENGSWIHFRVEHGGKSWVRGCGFGFLDSL